MIRALALLLLAGALAACSSVPSIVLERGERGTRCETLSLEGATAVCDGRRVDDWTRVDCSQATCVYSGPDGVQIDMWKAYKGRAR